MALGMTDRQMLFGVRLPLATPVIMVGIRTAVVLFVETVRLSNLRRCGLSRRYLNIGLQMGQTVVILTGAMPIAILAIAVD